MTAFRPGVSGTAIFFPHLRVRLEDWCEWTGQPWGKVEQVVGRAFRMCGPRQDAYTMAAGAVLRLIEAHEIDPRDVGQLALGTESSTDNAIGAVIVKGMVDEALRSRGLPPLARDCEVPEYKQACLGGVYGLLGAARYLACDGASRRAIVVASDVAEYERGSTGEQTQGAGAVAFLLDAKPGMFEIDLARRVGGSTYRALDFRKPFARHFGPGRDVSSPPRDYPVFNGRYSTACYLDQVTFVLEEYVARSGVEAAKFWDEVGAVFFHRPYHHLPVQALATALVRAWALSADHRDRLRPACEQAGVDLEVLAAEVQSPDAALAPTGARAATSQPWPQISKVTRSLRRDPAFASFKDSRLDLGTEWVREFGNLYTASLPAWLAAGFEDAARRGTKLEGKELLAVGYGSGDAAEALRLVAVPGWQDAALRTDITAALQGAVDLTREEYETLHDGRGFHTDRPVPGFFVERRGSSDQREPVDVGVDYYALR